MLLKLRSDILDDVERLGAGVMRAVASVGVRGRWAVGRSRSGVVRLSRRLARRRESSMRCCMACGSAANVESRSLPLSSPGGRHPADGVELCREDLSALVVMECARRDPTALRRRRTCESGAKGQSSSSLCSELGCVTCHVDGSVSTRTSVGRCVRVSFVRRSMDRSTCYATCVYQQGQRPRVGVARLECAGSDERGGRNAVGVAKSIQDGPKHVCAKTIPKRLSA